MVEVVEEVMVLVTEVVVVADILLDQSRNDAYLFTIIIIKRLVHQIYLKDKNKTNGNRRCCDISNNKSNRNRNFFKPSSDERNQWIFRYHTRTCSKNLQIRTYTSAKIKCSTKNKKIHPRQ